LTYNDGQAVLFDGVVHRVDSRHTVYVEERRTSADAEEWERRDTERVFSFCGKNAVVPATRPLSDQLADSLAAATVVSEFDIGTQVAVVCQACWQAWVIVRQAREEYGHEQDAPGDEPRRRRTPYTESRQLVEDLL
jgi:hypothetical protein